MTINGLSSTLNSATSAAQETSETEEQQQSESGSAGETDSALDSSMGKEDFLELLVTQLRNQDPMNPMEGQEFAAQLAQFSSVEQLININDTLESQNGNSALTQNLKNGLAADMLGTRVRAEGNSVNWKGDNIDLRFEMEAPAAETQLTIRDASGQVVRTEDLGTLGGGEQEFTWDGTNNDGEGVPNGNYTYSIEAVDSNGDSVGATTYLSGAVDRVTFGEDQILLWIGDRSIPMEEVRTIEQN